jgi:beta-galactosidase GanA
MNPSSSLPRLESSAGRTRLIVDGSPFLCLGGELHNSSSSDPSYMTPVWASLKKSGINSVVAAVGWDQVEPTEGEFEFAVVDSLLAGARSAGVRLVLIWFGAFKNALSTYAPTWVRADPIRFTRADRGTAPLPAPFTYEGSMPRPTLSVFSSALRAADRAAYAALMTHISRVDAEHTIVVMQVENEVGLLGASRDYSEPAMAAWNSPVPPELLDSVRGHPASFHDDVIALFAETTPSDGSWADRFGDGNAVADEVFMAWGFGRYLGDLAATGKTIKALPAYANAWLGPQPGQDEPGQYTSGGPTARMSGIWRIAAPDLDFVAPDIYVHDSEPVMREYAAATGTLFIPEARVLTGDAFRAIGGFNAIGYHVFGIDDVREGSQVFDAFRQLVVLAPRILDAQLEGRIMGFALDEGTESVTAGLGSITVVVRSAPKLLTRMLLDIGVRAPEPGTRPSESINDSHGPQPADARPFGIVLATGPLEYIAIGQQAMIDFSREGSHIEIDSVRELRLENGTFVDGRILNGDERLTILGVETVTAVKIKLLAL